MLVFGCALRIRAWVCLRRLALASGIRFGFRRSVWPRTFGKALRMQECDNCFGIVQLSGKLGEKRKYCKVSVKELEAGGCSGVFVSFISPGVLTVEGETHMDMMSLMLIYTPVSAS